MYPAELTTEEENVLGAIAALEASGQTGSVEAIARRAGLTPEMTRAVLSRLLGELGLVQEVEGDELGPYYALSGRAGAEATGASPAELQLDNIVEQLQRYVGDLAFPTTTERVVAAAANRGAPQPLLQAMRGLPDDQTFLTLQDLVDAVRELLSG